MAVAIWKDDTNWPRLVGTRAKCSEGSFYEVLRGFTECGHILTLLSLFALKK